MRWVRGPVAAMVHMLLRVGWRPVSPSAWETPMGVLAVAAEPPARLAELAREAATQRAWAAVAERRPRDSDGVRRGHGRRPALAGGVAPFLLLTAEKVLMPAVT